MNLDVDESAMTATEGKARNARTCVGCAEKAADRSALVRLVLGPGGVVAVDAAGGGFGRGAHVHATPECLAAAARGGLARAAKAKVTLLPDDGGEPVAMTVDALAAAVERAALARVGGLLSSAARAKALALGADAVTGACQRGDARLVVVATDAAAAADLTEVRRAVAEGRAIAWGSKAELGAVCGKAGRDGVGVVAVTSIGLAHAVRETMVVVDAARGAGAARGRPARAGKPRASNDRRPTEDTNGREPSARPDAERGGDAPGSTEAEGRGSTRTKSVVAGRTERGA